jgi:hypothetical protein
MGPIHQFGLHKVLGRLSPVVRPLLNWGEAERLAQCHNVEDLRQAAKRRMHPMCFGEKK